MVRIIDWKKKRNTVVYELFACLLRGGGALESYPSQQTEC